MIFCDRCGGMMIPDKGGKKKLVCGSCGKKINMIGSVMIKEKIRNNKEKIEVVDKDIEVNPKVEVECPSCGNMKAYFWTLQTRAADEAETRFYKCTKCGHRWRASE